MYRELKVYITNLLQGETKSLDSALCNYWKRCVDDRCRGCFLQEASLRLWRSTTTSQGRRLTWPSEKATSCRLSTTRKSQKPSASSSASRSDAAASQRQASEQIFQVARGRGRVQTRWLMSAAGAGDSDSKSDPLHLLAAAEWDDTPLLHPFPVVVIVSTTAAKICFPAGWLMWKLCCGCCGVWTGTGWASSEMNSTKRKWGVPNCILLPISLCANCVKSASKLKKYTNCELYCRMRSEEIILITDEQNNLTTLK